MPRGTAADNSFTPAEIHMLFSVASRIDESQLDNRVDGASTTMAFLVYFLGVLGFRLGFALHFDESDVERNADGEIVAISVPTFSKCKKGEGEKPCKHCQDLAKARAKNADKDGMIAEDYYSEYWSPKSSAGNRTIPVMQDRGKEIIDRFLEEHGELNMCAQTVRRRVTRLAEVTPGIDSSRMMPQSLRASAARFWMNWDEFDTDDLQLLMGWKYLSTAEYYLPSSSKKLRHTMARCLGKEPSPAFDVDPKPRTYAEIREDEELVSLQTTSPEGVVPEHEFNNEPDPLEAEAKAYQAELDEDGFEANIMDPITALNDWYWRLCDRLSDRLDDWWSDHTDFAPLERALQTQSRAFQLGFILVGTGIPLLYLAVQLAEMGVYIDPVTLDYRITHEIILVTMISSYLLYHEIADEWDELWADILGDSF